jgi:anti-sigma regulatory factor (Ser/Thr protein kinase)
MPGTSRSNGARSLPLAPRPGGRLTSNDRSGVPNRFGAPRGTRALARGTLGVTRGGHVHLRLPVEAESVTAAHHCVFGIAGGLDSETLDDLRLLISELVTNAMRHAGLTPEDWIDLVVDIGGDRVRVEVRDPGPGFDPARLPASKQAPAHTDGPAPRGGWGLEFLRRIAARWGVERNGLTSVWFELDLQHSPGSPGSPDRLRGRG